MKSVAFFNLVMQVTKVLCHTSNNSLLNKYVFCRKVETLVNNLQGLSKLTSWGFSFRNCVAKTISTCYSEFFFVTLLLIVGSEFLKTVSTGGALFRQDTC